MRNLPEVGRAWSISDSLRSSSLFCASGRPLYSHRLASKVQASMYLIAFCSSDSVARITATRPLNRTASCPRNTPREFIAPSTCSDRKGIVRIGRGSQSEIRLATRRQDLYGAAPEALEVSGASFWAVIYADTLRK